MKRILLLIKGLGRGGAERLLVSAAPYLDHRRYEYEVAYLLPKKDAFVEDLRRCGLAVQCLDGERGPGWIARLQRLVRDRRIDLIHSHSPFAAIGARLGTGPRMRHVYTEHNLWRRYHHATYWANALTFSRNDFVFTVSDHVRGSIRYPAALRFRAMPPVETLYYGLDPAAVADQGDSEDVRRELGIPRDVPVVGTIANFKSHKGFQYLLRAAVGVRSAIPDVRFVLVGTGPLEGRIRELARVLELDGTVIVAGYREDALRVAGIFDVFALSSIHEGLPIALIEAMSLGVPAVASDVGGTSEVMEDGRQGFIVPARDPIALAESIVTILRDPSLRERLGRAARRRAADFDIRKSVRRTEQIYEELLR